MLSVVHFLLNITQSKVKFPNKFTLSFLQKLGVFFTITHLE